MRPLKLEIQAMGPYRDAERIDFTMLGEKRFFLIHGPTGSGKTSILDAMTYALYGDTSGDERSLEQMRSQWADSDTESYVLFEFSVGDKNYRIKRSPRQTLSKKRGTGTREVDADATLWSFSPEESLLETGASKVTRRIEGLLGFNSGQFRQVIVLPQGKFRELLAAKGEGREEILKVLFGTERFTDIQNMIGRRAAEARRKLESLNLERDALLRSEGAESSPELEERAVALRGEAERLGCVVTGLEAEEKALQSNLKKWAVIEAKFVEMDSSRAALDELERRGEEMRGYSERINLWRRAGALGDIYRALAEERGICSGMEEKLRDSRDEFSAAESERAAAEKTLAELPGKKDELKLKEQELYRLESCRGIYGEIEKTDEDIRNNEKRKADAERESGSLTEKKVVLEEGIKGLREQLKGCELASAKLPALNMSMERIAAAGRKIAEIEKTSADMLKLEAEVRSLEGKILSASQRVDDLRSLRVEAEGNWMKGQAAFLASGLRSGEPCPVCGSVHHPAPALADGKTPGSEEIEKLRSDEKNADDQLRSVERDLSAKRAESDSLRGRVPEADDIPEEYRGLTRNDLERLYRSESAELKGAAKIASGVESLSAKLPAAEKELAETVLQLEVTASVAKEAEVALAALLSSRSRLCSGLPEGISDLKSLLERISEIQSEIEKISRSITDAENRWKEASGKFTAAETMYRKLCEDCASGKERLGAKEVNFSARLSESGFTSEMEFSALLGDAGRLKELEAVVENYRRDLASAKDRSDRACAGMGDTERPDIKSLSEKTDLARIKTGEAIAAMKGAESEAARLEKIIGRIKLTDIASAAEEESFGVIQKLADVAGGKNEKRLTFQRYVLQSLFEEVLMFASDRLERMSRGRYRLISPGRVGDRRLQAGLDLEVFDEYTGYSRPVVTLSGGEAFLASLSLALGLADLVQQYAGGIRLDTVFIDEGFGSLDSDTLDLAISTLIDLQSSGRLVGIISHVNDLKERIDARLEVIPVAYGSRTRFVV